MPNKKQVTAFVLTFVFLIFCGWWAGVNYFERSLNGPTTVFISLVLALMIGGFPGFRSDK